MGQRVSDRRDVDKFRGCLVGGAIGDALGYAVEFMRYDRIIAKYGKPGIADYELTDGVARISDDTQMTLFTANGLLYGTTRGALRGIAASPEDYVALCYQDWLKTQVYSLDDQAEHRFSWLMEIPELHRSRAPGGTCIKALLNKKPEMNSKGCGGVMRVAPVGLYFELSSEKNGRDQVAKTADAIAAITHGHDLGRIPAAALAWIINSILYYDYEESDKLKQIVADMLSAMRRMYSKSAYIDDFLSLMNRAVTLSESGDEEEECIRKLGEGWVAEETLAIAVYCALKHSNSFEQAIIAAVNHNGDSDSTGSVTGNILGAYLGYGAIPGKYTDNLELRDTILEIADDLWHDCTIEEYGERDEDARKWIEKYVYARAV